MGAVLRGRPFSLPVRCVAATNRVVRNDLDHLPASKQRAIARAVEILLEEFAEAIKGKMAPHRKAGRIVKIILYGSFARGDWVADRKGNYFSDYDLLVVVNHPELADFDYFHPAEERLARLRSEHVVKLEVFDWSDLNDQIAKGRPFFTDIRRDGIIIYENSPKELTRPGNLSPEEKHAEAELHYGEWSATMQSALKMARFAIGADEKREAAFNLHQACERAYHCLLLVYSLYSPKEHNIKNLRSRAEALEPSLIEAWPRALRRHRRAFERIKRAYIGARYSKHYRIEEEELAFAAEHVALLLKLVKEACETRLASDFAG